MILVAPEPRPLTPFPTPDANHLATSETTPPTAYIPANGLVAWYRAEDAHTGAAEPIWYDNSGNGNDLYVPEIVTDPDEMPQYDDSGAFPVFRWNGTTTTQYQKDGAPLYTGANPRSIIVVYQADDDTHFAVIAGQTSLIVTIPSFQLVTKLGNAGVYGVDTVVEVVAAFSTNYRWAIATYDGTDSMIETADGSDTLTEALDSSGVFEVGGGGPTSSRFAGSIAEIFVYDHKLTTEEQAALVAFLEDKYSL